MVNSNMLKGKIIERGSSINEISKIIGVNKATFYRKLKCGEKLFSVGEAEIISKHLILSDEEKNNIFFAS
ncbi:MAG: helix-turn-helix domain-containing protein [Oscillospiraceae bacterium]|nr:helix-turn-helix domain-containing protein [Oscillospiraceae bacterium]